MDWLVLTVAFLCGGGLLWARTTARAKQTDQLKLLMERRVLEMGFANTFSSAVSPLDRRRKFSVIEGGREAVAKADAKSMAKTEVA